MCVWWGVAQLNDLHMHSSLQSVVCVCVFVCVCLCVCVVCDVCVYAFLRHLRARRPTNIVCVFVCVCCMCCVRWFFASPACTSTYKYT